MKLSYKSLTPVDYKGTITTTVCITHEQVTALLAVLPLDITELTISNTAGTNTMLDMTVLPDLSRFTNLTELLLSSNNNKLERFPPSHFPPNLRHLDCSYTAISDLSNLPLTVEKINCYCTKITKLPLHLPNLNHISFGNCPNISPDLYGVISSDLNSKTKIEMVRTILMTCYPTTVIA